ncbi:hypothetical protein DICPUDRAFT_19461, partial [Dictyostelium purpureum]
FLKKIWRNFYIKSEILKRLKLFRLVYNYSSNSNFVFNLNTLCNFKYKDFLLDVHLISMNLLIKSGVLPKSITHLSIGSNCGLEPGSIPNRVKKLTFRNQFNNNDVQIVPYIIPNSVEILHFISYNSTQRYDVNVIPPSVHTLLITNICHPLEYGSIPPSVTNLEVGFDQPHKPNVIPPSVTVLAINTSIEYLTIDSIPNSVKHLVFDNFKNEKIPPNCIPSSVEYLEFSNSYNQPIDGSFFKDIKTSNLKTIVFGSRFNNKILPGSLPNSLKSITFGFHYNLKLEETNIPKGVEHIKFNYIFNQALKGLPDSLTKLELGYCFDQPILPNTLPQNLHYLEF